MVESALAALIVFAIGVNFALQGGDLHMSPAWYPVIAVIGVQFLGVAAIWGSLNTKVTDHERRLGDLEKQVDNLECPLHTTDIAVIKRELGIE